MKLLLLLGLLTPICLLGQEALSNITVSKIQKNSFTLHWNSPHTGITAVKYGLTPSLELGLQQQTIKSQQQHQITLTQLEAAHFYYAQPLLIQEQDTLYGTMGYYSTQSNSSGVIRVLFNQGIDPTYSTGVTPYISSGPSTIENEIISMINQATSTIDIAVYNNTRSAIVQALTNAHNNGIRVRYIANSGSITSNAALSPAPPFPVFYANANDLMHNKFMIIDAGNTNNAWVWTGSCNWTYTDMYTNYNNFLAIQDQALAQAYVIEFEEMWGSSTANYNSTTSRVGSSKTNNTPHQFNIGGRTIECYFSPSDGTTDEIESALYSADNDIEFCLLAFTRNELGTAIRNEHQSGTMEHGIMENINDIGSEYNWLVGQGVNILADNHSTDLHHKYAIVDAGNNASDPQVITGSHNWTTAAEERNDENILIIHDAAITNLYLQEFTARWCEVKNHNNCALPFTVSSTTALESEAAIALFPNPAQNSFSITASTTFPPNTIAHLYTTTGQLIKTYPLQATKEQQFNTHQLDNGLYFLVIPQLNWQTAVSILR